MSMHNRIRALERYRVTKSSPTIAHHNAPFHEGPTSCDVATKDAGETLPDFLARARTAWRGPGPLHIELSDEDVAAYRQPKCG